MAKKKKAVTPMRMRRRSNQRHEMSAFGPLLIASLIGLAIFSLEAVGVAIVGLAPTVVLGFTAKGALKAERIQCVGFMNIAGVLPFVVQAIEQPRDITYIIFDPINLATMYGSAAVGYALIHVGPLIAAIILQSLAQERVKNINQQRQALIELWGAEVLGDKDGAEEEPAWAQGRRPNVSG